MVKAQLSPRRILRAKIAGASGDLHLQSRTVSPSTKRMILRPGEGYNGFDTVIVEGVPDANLVAFSTTQITPDMLYTIGQNWFAQVVERTQEMAGTKRNMTPSDILLWLNRVKYIPQGWATTEIAIVLAPAATGKLPYVVKGTANCEYALGLTPAATGTLQEG